LGFDHVIYPKKKTFNKRVGESDDASRKKKKKINECSEKEYSIHV
jgi:hypothetical protein